MIWKTNKTSNLLFMYIFSFECVSVVLYATQGEIRKDKNKDKTWDEES